MKNRLGEQMTVEGMMHCAKHGIYWEAELGENCPLCLLVKENKAPASGAPIMKHFVPPSYLPERLFRIGRRFHGIALDMQVMLPDDPEKSAGLRKLLEARDCFMRASLTEER